MSVEVEVDPRPPGLMSRLVLAQVVGPHKTFLTVPTYELLHTRVNPLMPGQLVTPGDKNV